MAAVQCQCSTSAQPHVGLQPSDLPAVPTASRLPLLPTPIDPHPPPLLDCRAYRCCDEPVSVAGRCCPLFTRACCGEGRDLWRPADRRTAVSAAEAGRASCPASSTNIRSLSVSESLVKELVSAGVHFGHRASLWNPKMAPYIYARKNQIHIIDIRETVRGLVASAEVSESSCQRGQSDSVCGDQASGGGRRGAGVPAVRHAVCRRALVGRRVDQFPDDSQPAGSSGGTRSACGPATSWANTPRRCSRPWLASIARCTAT